MLAARRRHPSLHASVLQVASRIGLKLRTLAQPDCREQRVLGGLNAPEIPRVHGSGWKFSHCRGKLGVNGGVCGHEASLASWHRQLHRGSGPRKGSPAFQLAETACLEDNDDLTAGSFWNNGLSHSPEATAEKRPIRAAVAKCQAVAGSVPESHVLLAVTLIKGICGWYPSEEHARNNVRFLLNLGAAPHEVARLFKRHRPLFLYDASADLLSKTSLLEHYGLDPAILLQMRQPLGASCHLKSTLEFLSRELRLPPPEIQQMLLKCPSLLDSDPGRARAAAQLMEVLGERKPGMALLRYLNLGAIPASKDALGRQLAALSEVVPDQLALDLVRRMPKLLQADPSTISRHVAVLRDAFDGPAVLRILSQRPELLVDYDPRTIQNTYVELMLAFGEERARHMVLRQPALLTMSWRRIQEKLDYLEGAMGRSRDEVARCPTVLCRSLEHCIMPRHQCLQEAAGLYSLSHLLGCSEAVFRQRFAALLNPKAPAKERAEAGMGQGSRQGSWQGSEQGSAQSPGQAPSELSEEEDSEDAPESIQVSRPPAKRTLWPRSRKELRAHFGANLAAQIVAKEPRIERMLWSILLPKLEYLEKALGMSREAVAAHPYVLRRSLAKCIIPRMEALGGDCSIRRLGCVFTLSDRDFEARFKVKLPAAISEGVQHSAESDG